jgi:hypothetical protein
MEQQQKPEHIDELITSYLDGELPIEKEDAMFSSLASNSEDSRSAMRELVSMRNVIPHDIEAFTPPPGAKDAVFSQLGMATQSAEKGKSGWKKAILPLAFLALGLAGGYGFGDSFSSNEKDEILQLMRKQGSIGGFSPLISTGDSPKVPTIVLQQSAPVRIVYKDRMRNMASVTPMITLPPISVNQSANVQDVANQNGSESQSNKHTTKEILSETNTQTQENSKLSEQSNAIEKASPIQIAAPNATVSNIEPVKYPQFWMQFRGMSSLQSPEYLGIREQMGILDNSRVTFAWSLGEHFSVGLEAGREPFVLNYQGIKEDRPFVFNQYSPMLTGGLFLQGRTSAFENLGNSRFYVQAVAGGTEIGVLGRLGLGIAYPISNHISLQLGLEQSYMQFQFQGNAFNSQKLDLLYGISIIL